MKNNVILIGMPASGKSTIGVLLAKRTSRRFMDTDLVIQEAEGRSLQAIVDTDGHMALRDIEERILLGIDTSNSVIATGGSAAYSEAAMRHLGDGSVVAFLDVPIDELVARIHNYATRGIAKHPDQTFEDLFHERGALYRRYADITIDCMGKNHEEVVTELQTALANQIT
jgi:shikimate kinase